MMGSAGDQLGQALERRESERTFLERKRELRAGDLIGRLVSTWTDGPVTPCTNPGVFVRQFGLCKLTF